MLLLNKMKDDLGKQQKSSVPHNAIFWSNGMMNAYTTNDTFLRDNLSWAESATNWNRFMVIASLGMVHQGNREGVEEILNPYFTGLGNAGQEVSSPYSTAGAYYAYGLVHENHFNQQTMNFLLDGFRNSAQSEPIQHGVSLALGLTAMATKNQEIYDSLRDTLFNNADSAIIGEGSAFAMGMVMSGSGDQAAIEEMFQHANDSKHEKIIRALSISLALTMLGREESADGLITQMT